MDFNGSLVAGASDLEDINIVFDDLSIKAMDERVDCFRETFRLDDKGLDDGENDDDVQITKLINIDVLFIMPVPCEESSEFKKDVSLKF
jgi:hypothetical protein